MRDWRDYGRIRAITLHQPWASLIACGQKEYETRSWRPPTHRECPPLAIHAGLRVYTPHEDDPLASLLDLAELDLATVPRGAVVAVCRLGVVRPTEVWWASVSAAERAAGDWSEGRWAWELYDVEALAKPIPAKGHQGLWWWEVPSDA